MDDVDWTDQIDSYCERTGPGLLAEPVNAVSNLAFLVAAFAVWRSLQRAGRPIPASLRALVALVAVIGLGSGAFHTFATVWASAADVLPISAFMVFYLVCYLHWFWGVRWGWAWWSVPAFVLFSLTVTTLVTVTLGGQRGSTGYVPALAVLAGAGVALLNSDRTLRRCAYLLVGAAGLFTVSLALRTLDEPLCAALPLGTHFLWHVLNAMVLYLVCQALVLRWSRLGDTPPSRSVPHSPER
ncbi:ceramidase domain-containing protein [Streptoalloteichus hindustanus]|uniref:ceramidase domain-containing protein n=1 Tax=Streptoalloteichus hindustanus TaxID=2017 RepID=UPI001F1E7DBE|nr:ceramidase domain-containing protein [Streptoalloteichus hindustanus]